MYMVCKTASGYWNDNNQWQYLDDTLTLYTNWIPIGYTITFDSNDGTGSMSDQSMTYDTPAALTANAFTRQGYTFTGWSTTADGSSGTAYSDGETVSNLTSTDGDTITLYAQWQKNPYTVTIPKRIVFNCMSVGCVSHEIPFTVSVSGDYAGTVTVKSTPEDLSDNNGGTIKVTSASSSGFEFTAADDGKATSQTDTITLSGTANVGMYAEVVQYECTQSE